MTRREDAPDVDRLARSMLELFGAHGDHDHRHDSGSGGSWSKAPAFGTDRAEALHAATARDKERYLTSGLVPVDCRHCHATVAVRKLGPGHTAVQWSSDAAQRCAFFAEIRAAGGDSSRVRACPRMSDSIKHAVAEGCLEEYSSAPPPGDG